MIQTLNLHSLAYPVTALGPGQRLVIWVSGCSLNCKGCISPELQPKDSGKSVKIDTLVKRFLELPVVLDGITLSGGEPFEQPQALTALLIKLKKARPNWNVLAFSGYPLGYLRRNADCQKLLAEIDILVDNPYLQNCEGDHPLTASKNQRVHYLTPQGEALREACETLTVNQANLAIGESPTQRLVGIIRSAERQQIHQKLNLTHPL
jgi:anaerobic ribonucleoside-triphosphate reductase activating protein